MTEQDQKPAVPQLAHGDKAEAINSSIHYTMWSVFRFSGNLPTVGGEPAAVAEDALARLAAIPGLNLRGWYDTSGFRADADLMVWWWAEDVETLQDAYHALRATALGSHLEPVWSSVGIHRQAEFNSRHVPAFLAGEQPRDYICVYPFVRSYEWYVMEESERRAMLHEHGLAARDYGDVRANTVSSFALGDYEWLLAFEADTLHRIVDLMRELRDTRARLHVREEIPFFTGPRVELADWVAKQPGA